MSRKDFIAGYMAGKKAMRKTALSSTEVYSEAERLVREYGEQMTREIEKARENLDFKIEKEMDFFVSNVHTFIEEGISAADDGFDAEGFRRYVIDDLADKYRPAGWTFDW